MSFEGNHVLSESVDSYSFESGLPAPVTLERFAPAMGPKALKEARAMAVAVVATSIGRVAD